MYTDADRKYLSWLEENQPEHAEYLINIEQVLSELEASYQQPRYDPYEVFDPPRGMIVDISKKKNEEAADILREIRNLKPEDRTFLLPILKERHATLINEVESMKFKLNNHKRTGKWTGTNDGRFTDEDKERVKSVPIEQFYPGRFRSSGGRLFGICPFHTEKTGSFVVYKNSNTYHCFGCGENGDVIKFVQKMQNLSFVEAVRFLLGMV